ncbi:MAG: bifunctional UDP-N-acetylglucosamine diphosphorylase/glucosamine-1-phosphate N-acetyltransferase GlmU [Firmicutes bacterium]|nr:bifunctional UDP-N-acetylglucosamine diphosphorylase/glucosamine-1-phosphate N-acetyltransferase GlmU [Bacillota bacterium]
MKEMAAIVLAAGKGTRMVSAKPKVLHELLGKPMIDYVLQALRGAEVSRVVTVIGSGAEEVREHLGDACSFALQEPQLGTGHAVMQGLPCLGPEVETVMVVCGDTPLLTKETLQGLKTHFEESRSSCTVLTAVLDDPAAYGRILRDDSGALLGVVEARDASPRQLAIQEINSGVYCFVKKDLEEAIGSLTTGNQQGEYYLTDTIAVLRNAGKKTTAFCCGDPAEIQGVNDRCQLAEAEGLLRARKNRQLMLSGVTLVDPDTVYIDAGVEVGMDTVIGPSVYIGGASRVGSGCQIGPWVKIVDSQVGDGVSVGPFAYLRPGTVLADHSKAGHFVEIKNSQIGAGSKVPHLSYIGDAELGENVNVGCGTITCNYDGVAKYRTKIGDGTFIGSNSNFIAPVEVGNRCTIGAGSTITADVPDGSLAIARSTQRIIENWAGKRKKTAKE